MRLHNRRTDRWTDGPTEAIIISTFAFLKKRGDKYSQKKYPLVMVTKKVTGGFELVSR